MKTYICHRLGEERENHKYIARVLLKKGSGRKPNIYRYFYDKEKYQVYLKNKQVSQQKINVAKSSSDNISIKGKQITTNILSKTGTTKVGDLKEVSNGFKSFVNNLATKMKETISKPFDKIEEHIQEKRAEKIDKNRMEAMKQQAMIRAKYDNQDRIDKGREEAMKQQAMIRAKYDNQDRIDKGREEAMKQQAKVRRKADIKESFENALDDKEIIKTNKKYTNDEHQEMINPEYHSFSAKALVEYLIDEDNKYKYTRNCANCTMAYEMRKRGYDVKAAYWYENDPTAYSSYIESCYVDPKVKIINDIDETNENNTIDSIETNILNEGNGARGSFVVTWRNTNYGHSMVWEVENGEVVIRDCQTNSKHTIDEIVMRSSDVRYFRTDNLDLTKNAVADVEKRRKKILNK